MNKINILVFFCLTIMTTTPIQAVYDNEDDFPPSSMIWEIYPCDGKECDYGKTCDCGKLKTLEEDCDCDECICDDFDCDDDCNTEDGHIQADTLDAQEDSSKIE